MRAATGQARSESESYSSVFLSVFRRSPTILKQSTMSPIKPKIKAQGHILLEVTRHVETEVRWASQ